MRKTSFLSMFSALVAFGALSALVACGDTVGTPIVPSGDALTTGPGSSTDAGDTTPEVGQGDASGGDAGEEPAPGDFVATVTVDVFGQNCMPAVPPDPVTLQGRLKIENTGKTPIGPVTITSAAFLDPTTKQVVGTFAATASTPAVAPGATSDVVFTKTADSLNPGNGCATVKCNNAYLVRLELSGAGIGSGATATSAEANVGCVF